MHRFYDKLAEANDDRLLRFGLKKVSVIIH